MKLYEIQNEQIDEGLKQRALAGILSLGLAFASQVGATEVFIYTADNGKQEVVRTYDEVPKGKIVYVVDIKNMNVKKIQKQIQDERYVKAHKDGDISDKIRRQMFRTDI